MTETNRGGRKALAERLDVIRSASGVAALRLQFSARWPAFADSRPKELIIVGAAGEGVRLAGHCNDHGILVRAIADDDNAKLGKALGANRVVSIEQLAPLPKDIPVIVASHRALLPVRRIRQMGFTTVAPLLALQVISPRHFPPHMFHDGLIEDLYDNIAQYQKLADLLADDRSAAVLAAVIQYRLTGEPEVLDPITEWELYGAGALLSYAHDEVYVDAGTFDGDSIRLFIERVAGKFERVYGFEPDPVTFQRLKMNFAGEPRVVPINAGLYSKTGTLRFDNAGTRGSILSDSGAVVVPVVGLDEVLKDNRVSYVKMNIEGAELDALDGAAASIRRWNPKLALSAYHRPSHLWQVPAKVKELDPRYQLYFRQHDGGIIETVCYAKVPD